MNELRTLGKAMRKAQREFDAAQDWDAYENNLAAMQAAEAAFDKALAAAPAPAPDVAELVKALRWPADFHNEHDMALHHKAAAALSERNEIIALAATDYLRTKDKWTSEPLLREKFPRMLAELAETGEWMREYVRDRNGAMAELADRMKAAEARVKALEEALEPFAALADRYDPDDGDSDHAAFDQTAMPTIGQLRCARTALRSDG